MSVLKRLASSLHRKDEVPNMELAKNLADEGDERSVKELVKNLDNKDKSIQSDCIKVLYEIGERRPALIADYFEEFVNLLKSKDNRLVWGAMTALDMIALERPSAIYNALSAITLAADGESIIARDHAVSILIKLASIKKYEDDVFKLLLNQIAICPTNQLPMYAEMSLQIVEARKRSILAKTLASRIGRIEKESKRKRLEKVIRKLKTLP